MSVKQQIGDCLTEIHDIDTCEEIAEYLGKIANLVAQLQEPQAVRVAPDIPMPGQLFWMEIDGMVRRCKAYGILSEGRLKWYTDEDCVSHGGVHRFGFDEDIKRWIPVTPPTFPEERS